MGIFDGIKKWFGRNKKDEPPQEQDEPPKEQETRQPSSVGLFLNLMISPDIQAKKVYLEQHPELLTDEAEIAITQFINQQNVQHVIRSMEQHRAILRRARTDGLSPRTVFCCCGKERSNRFVYN